MSERHFAICLRNDGVEGALELRKLYEIVRDEVAENRASIRVIDESGEDYVYPADWFVTLDLPQHVETQISEVSPQRA